MLYTSHPSLRELAPRVRSFDVSGYFRHKTLVPKELNYLQKEYRKQVSSDIMGRDNSDPTFMERIKTVDKT